MVPRLVSSKVVYLAPFFIGPLSLCCSAAIVFLLLRPVNRSSLRHRPKEQFLVGLSLLDMCSSFAASFSTLPSPRISFNADHVDAYVFLGTVGTCEAQGFFAQLGYGAPMYNAAIAVYLVLSVICKVPDRIIMRRMVPACHVLIGAFCLSTSVAGLALNLYNAAGMLGCWIHEAGGLARICGEEGLYCDRVELDYVPFEIGFGIAPVGISLAVVVVSMIALTTKVYITERLSSRFSFRRSINSRTQQRDSMNCTSMGAELPLTQRTMETGLLYSLTLMLIYIPMGLLALGVIPSEQRFIVRMLAAILTPSQGLFNLLVFTSPQWLEWLHKRRFCEVFSSCCVGCLCFCGTYFSKRSGDGDLGLDSGDLDLSSEHESVEGKKRRLTHASVEFMLSPSLLFDINDVVPSRGRVVPPVHQSVDEEGPSDSENGPSDSESGPSDSENGPSDSENGPSDSESGPSDCASGPRPER